MHDTMRGRAGDAEMHQELHGRTQMYGNSDIQDTDPLQLAQYLGYKKAVSMRDTAHTPRRRLRIERRPL